MGGRVYSKAVNQSWSLPAECRNEAACENAVRVAGSVPMQTKPNQANIGLYDLAGIPLRERGGGAKGKKRRISVGSCRIPTHKIQKHPEKKHEVRSILLPYSITSGRMNTTERTLSAATHRSRANREPIAATTCRRRAALSSAALPHSVIRSPRAMVGQGLLFHCGTPPASHG